MSETDMSDEVTVREFVELAGSIGILSVKLDTLTANNKAEHEAIAVAINQRSQDALKVKLALLGSGTSVLIVVVSGIISLL